MKDNSLDDVIQKCRCHQPIFLSTNECLDCGLALRDQHRMNLTKEPDSVGKQDNVYAKQIRSEVLEEVAVNLKLWYPDHAAINAYCAAVRSMKK